jgi:hypothetical protein
MDLYNRAQQNYFLGKGTSKDVLLVLALRRQWEQEAITKKGTPA